MRSWIRISLALGLLSLLAWSLAPAGPAAAAEGEETTTPTTEEPPPVVETPPPVETPTETPPPASETPVTTTPSEVVAPPSGTTPVESTRSSGSTGAGSGSSSGGGGSTTTSGSSGTTTTSPGTTTTHRSSHVRSEPTRASGGGGGGSKPSRGSTGSAGGSGGGNGTATSGGNSSGGGASHDPGSRSGGGGSQASNPQPSFSSQGFDEGASAVSNVASHVGEAFAEALPTAPLKKIGTQIGAHVGLIPAQSGVAQKHAVDRLGTALGAALLGSAVAVERTPHNQSPIPFFDPPGGKSGTIYLILIAALVLAIAALILREVRSALGLTGPRTGVRVADQRPRISARDRAELSLSRLRASSDRSFRSFRRLSANALSGVRSLF